MRASDDMGPAKRRPSISKATLPLWIFILAVLLWLYAKLNTGHPTTPASQESSRSEVKALDSLLPTPGDKLLEGYADPATEPIEDLRKVHRVVAGYFSVIKDASRFAIGGNEDLSAALRGENPNREIFVRSENPVFSGAGLLTDRWGSAIIVHPEAWKQLSLRSAGPDKIPYNEDDLILHPNGTSGSRDPSNR